MKWETTQSLTLELEADFKRISMLYKMFKTWESITESVFQRDGARFQIG